MDTNTNLSHPVRIFALGRFDIEVAGKLLLCEGARACKPMELLMGLVAAGTRGLSQNVLCEQLWPDSEGDAAYRALITTVYRLRRALAQHTAVGFAGGRVSLNKALCWVDAWDFEQLADHGSDDAGRRKALALYTGALFNDTETSLVIESRNRLRRKFVRCVLQLASHRERAGHAAEAIALLEHALDADVSSEELHCALIATLGNDEQTLAARSAYQRCRSTLLRHFGTVPSPVTERTYHAACTPQAGLRTPTFNAAAAVLSAGALPF
jgi:DNA-binding SARP family transcriptional activator